jgi:S-adenosylmethionine:tRNA ribosyltransferase-isomerase
VVRALEGNHRDRGGRPGQGVTDLRITPDFVPQVVDGILTNMHLPGESHFELLAAFAGPELLAAAGRHAVARGYLAHEFGDVMLILS